MKALLRTVALGACLASLAASSNAVAQNLISNPGFETGAIPDCGPTNMAAPWIAFDFTPDVLTNSCAAMQGWDDDDSAVMGLSSASGLRFAGASYLFSASASERFGQGLTATAGESFQLSGSFARAVIPPFDDGHFEVWVSNAADSVVVVGTIAEDVGSSWEFDSLGFTVPFDVVFWGLQGASSAAGLFLTYAVCDDLVLTRVAASVDPPGIEGIAQSSQLWISPNPMTLSASIAFQAPPLSEVQLDIFDATGRLVTNLIEGRRLTGRHEVVWQGQDATGPVASGVYYVRLVVDGESTVRPVTVLR